MSDEDWECIEAAFLDRGVLIFPGQHLDDEQQMAFGRRWGELNESQSLSNRRPDGTLRDADDPLMRLFRGNEGWHTDSSFEAVSAKASILLARQVPGRGGQTEWADMRAAYEARDQTTRDYIAGLEAYHSLYHSQESIGESGESTAQALAELHAMASSGTNSSPSLSGYRQQTQVPLWPLVKLHPQTAGPPSTLAAMPTGFPGSPRTNRALCSTGFLPARVRHRACTAIAGRSAMSSSGTTGGCCTGYGHGLRAKRG